MSGPFWLHGAAACYEPPGRTCRASRGGGPVSSTAIKRHRKWGSGFSSRGISVSEAIGVKTMGLGVPDLFAREGVSGHNQGEASQ